ncbi:MAG: glycosyltransferase [Pseudomonadota bacterium]
MKPVIAIGICTRQRNALLRRLLESIWKQNFSYKYDLKVIVVDNNDAPTVTPHIVTPPEPQTFEVFLVHEPNAGLANARNRVLDIATELNAQWLIGVDDDEWVAADWLSGYITAFETLETSIIVGAQRTVYPDTLSPFVEKRQQEQLPAGAPSRVFSTANYALHADVFHTKSGLGLRFDPAFNESGGEDFEFMLRAQHQHGIIPLNWPHALAIEPYDGERTGFSYHLKRHLIDQITRYRVWEKHRKLGIRGTTLGNVRKRLRLTMRFAVLGLSGCLRGAAFLFVNREKAAVTFGIGLTNCMRAIAIFPYLFGASTGLYGRQTNADRSIDVR